MTLVVARILKNNFICVSDSQQCLKNGEQKDGITEGCIKSIVFGDFCLAFSGNIDCFEDFLSNIKDSMSVETIVDIALQQMSICTAPFDILLYKKGDISFVEIKDKVCQHVTASYLGNAAAFEDYQKIYHANSNVFRNQDDEFAEIRIIQVFDHCMDQVNEAYIKSVKCMQLLIESRSHNDVGGICVPVMGNKKELTYGYYIDIYANQPKGDDNNGVVTFGTVGGGCYQFEFNHIANNPVVFFPALAFGVIFDLSASKIRNPVKHKDETACYWLISTTEMMNGEIRSGLVGLREYVNAGSMANKSENYKLALKCYESAHCDDGIVKGDVELMDRFAYGYAFCLIKLGHTEKGKETLRSICRQSGSHPLSERLLERLSI